MRISLRLVLSLSGLAFSVLDGMLAFGITWTVSINEIDRIAEDLRASAISIVQRRILSVTGGVQQLSARNARGLVGNSRFGCCSLTQRDSLYTRDFPDMRSTHYLNIVSNPNIILSYSASAGGNLLLLYRANDSRIIDATNARQGQGNLRWTISDQSTAYIQHRYFANTWKSGLFERAQTSVCGAGYVGMSSDNVLTVPLVSRDECVAAAAQLGYSAPVDTATETDSPKCYVTDDGQAFWNPRVTSPTADDTARKALCRTGKWFRERQLFVPNCTHGYPCTEGGYQTVTEPGFNDTLYSTTTSVYNATVRSWYVRAVENAATLGRDRPSWSTIYLSINAGELVLPSVFTFFAGTSDYVRCVLVLGIGLKFLDSIVDTEVKSISSDSSGWIVDLHPLKAGSLLASSPTGLSTAAPQTQTSSGSIVSVYAVNASVYNSAGALVQKISRELVSRFHTGSDHPSTVAAQAGWGNIAGTVQFSMDAELIQTKILEDDYGLKWLIALSVPEEVFLGDLPAARTFTIVFVVLLTVLCAGVLFAITQLVTMDLLKLGSEMEKCAHMKLDAVAEGRKSCLSELSWMEVSFSRMHSNLKEYRNYLPASVLQDEDGGESMDGGDEDPAREVSQASPASPGVVSVTSSNGPRVGSPVLSDDGGGRKKPSFRSGGERKPSWRTGAARADKYGIASDKAKAQFSEKVTTRLVTVLTANIRRFLQSAGSGQDLQKNHATTVQQLVEECRKHKGIPDTFMGDRVYINFNASNSVVSHRTQASRAALKCAGSGGMLVTVGLASGRAPCGNFGFQGMKKFTIAGTVVNFAALLERLCQASHPGFGVATLADDLVVTESRTFLNTLCVGQVAFDKHGPDNFFVHTLLGEAQADTEEWMYQMQQKQGNIYSTLNTAMRAGVTGGVLEARSLLRSAGVHKPQGSDDLQSGLSQDTATAYVHTQLEAMREGESSVANEKWLF
eukprot:TRINITY_DN16206_c0_g1_i1.p1 TRINITY_DN16206_c0_g1~~TRINITY_DN16206_c0_g1_i1.p1  ORF type:complete len:960 (+),score=298.69 TRINITY_DN16206_c0_g1_i1:134-3013(+)